MTSSIAISLFSSLGYATTIAFLSFFIKADGPPWKFPLVIVAVSVVPFIVSVILSIYIFSTKLQTATTLKSTIFWGVAIGGFICAITAFSSGIINGIVFHKEDPQWILTTLSESFLYLIGGLIYGLVGFLVFGSLLGYFYYKIKKT